MILWCCSMVHSSSPDLHALLASGSSNAIIYVHNLHCAIGEGLTWEGAHLRRGSPGKGLCLGGVCDVLVMASLVDDCGVLWRIKMMTNYIGSVKKTYTLVRKAIAISSANWANEC